MQAAAMNLEFSETPMAGQTARYARAIKASKRVRWDIDADVIRDRSFDFNQTFLPAGLSMVEQTDLPHAPTSGD